MSGLSLLIGLGLLVAGQSSESIPTVDLTRVEPAVAAQLRSVRDLLVEVTGRTGATAGDRGAAFGEFGRILHAYGYHLEAATCYQQAIQLLPEEVRWRHLLGTSLEQAGQLPEAAAALQAALERDRVPATELRLAGVLLQLNRHDEARQIYDRLLQADDALAAAHAGRGLLALEVRDYATAIQHLTRALELAPAARRLHYSLAMAHRGAGHLDQAREHLRQRGTLGLKASDPWIEELDTLIRGSHLHSLRGRMALSAGAVSDAIREYQHALEAAPDDHACRVNLAVAYSQAGKLEDAARELETVLARSPEHTTARFNLALVLERQQRREDAVIHLQAVLARQSTDQEAWRLLAVCQTELQQSDAALQTLQQAHRASPDDEQTLLMLAERLADARKYAEITTLLGTAWKRHPERGLTTHALARHLVDCPDAGQRDAVRGLELARRVHAARPTLEHGETLAMALAISGKFPEAARLQSQLLESARQQNVNEKTVERLKANLERYQQPPQ